MNFLDKDKVWTLILLLVVGGLFTLNGNLLYSNGWSNADTINLISLVLGITTVNAIKQYREKG